MKVTTTETDILKRIGKLMPLWEQAIASGDIESLIDADTKLVPLTQNLRRLRLRRIIGVANGATLQDGTATVTRVTRTFADVALDDGTRLRVPLDKILPTEDRPELICQERCTCALANAMLAARDAKSTEERS